MPALYWPRWPVSTPTGAASRKRHHVPIYDAPYQWSRHLYGLIEEGERQNEQLAVCVRHQGAHPYYLDGCHEIPKGLSKRERVAIYARSLEWQTDPEPQLLEMDVQSMAAAFVTAMRAARDDRKQDAPASPPPPQPRRNGTESSSRDVRGVNSDD